MHGTNRVRKTLLRWAIVLGWAIAVVPNDAFAAEPISGNLSRIFSGNSPRTVGDLRAMESHVKKLAKKVTEATVHVRLGAAHGSGVIVSKDGYILTAAHVAGRPGQVASVILADGRPVNGISLGLHFKLDAGMIQITDPGEWPFLMMAEPLNISTNEWCAATGHPGGYEEGRSPVFRVGRILDQGGKKLIRTDCQLIGGDSGGPLVNMYGEVIGIHSRIGSSLANNQHVPVSAYLDHWNQLVSGETLGLGSPWMGVKALNGSTSTKVSSVTTGSPADRAGIQEGDIITHFDGHRIHSFRELSNLVKLRTIGDKVRILVERDKQQIRLRVTLGQRGL